MANSTPSIHRPIVRTGLIVAGTMLLAILAGFTPAQAAPRIVADEVVLRLPMPTAGPNSMDPVRGSSQYDNRACNMVFETLLEYEYLKRPFELKPCLLESMPVVSEDGKRYRFRLQQNTRFQDDECFPKGMGREVVTDDVFYSLKRMADDDNEPKGWWLLKDTIVGFDEYRKSQNAADTFDYDAPVEGMKKINDYEFEIHLQEPLIRFTYTLAMFQTSVMAREAVEHYGDRLSRHPIGTGPFMLEHWRYGSKMKFVRNPTYRDDYYPSPPTAEKDDTAEGEPYPGFKEDVALGFYVDAGKKLPLADRVVFTMFVETQPMWLKFRNREIDYTTVPAENYQEAFIKRNRRLRKSWVDDGIRSAPVPLLDFIYNGFNMEDPVFGGYEDKDKYLRQAISLAYNLQEANQAFYNGINLIYDGPIPDGLDGHPEGHTTATNYRGPNLQKARQLLAKAGYPGGKNLPKLVYYTSRQPQSVAMARMSARNLAKIGIKMEVNPVDFSTLSEKLRNKAAPFFGLAWGSDYPDAENNLQLFYGPYKSPQSNNFNYDRPEYNRLYEQVRVMPPSPERTKLYEQMRDMVIEDAVVIGSMARIRSYLIHDQLQNFKPVEVFTNWPKYLTVESR